MSDAFVGEIRSFGFNFAPNGWAQCNGQLLPISQNTALFSILGTTYGGDGKTTFALPNLQGRIPLHFGQGSGLTNRSLGEPGGNETVTLTTAQVPSHSHNVQVVGASSGTPDPSATSTPAANTVFGVSQARAVSTGYATVAGNLAAIAMSPNAVSAAGGGQPHNNLSPYLVVNYCIAMQGVYPSHP